MGNVSATKTRSHPIAEFMGNVSATKTIRLVHRYLGLFFAPAIVFFSFSGALQTLGLHETSRGSSYVPPSWIVRMAQLHKKQTFYLPAPKIKAQAASVADPQDGSAKHHSGERKKKAAIGTRNSEDGTAKFALKGFVFVMSIALMLSTILGVIMALRYGGDARVVWMVVLSGVLFPIAVTML